ncbi:MAG TPA: histidine kinase [Anaerolineales bacterium]|nr:histidine kinase [Anaerolineales bacterium]
MKKNWWRSLRVKIIAWSFVPTVIILSAVAWFTFYSYQIVIGDLAIKQYPEIIQPKAVVFGQTLSGIVNPILLPILMDIDTNHELPLEVRAQNILDQAPGLEIFDGGIYLLDQQGKVFKTQPPQPELIGQDWSDTPHFRSVNATPNLGAWTDLITIGSSSRKIFCVAMAMSGQTWDEVLGAMYYCFTVYPASQNTFYQKITSLDLGSNVYVLDRHQQIIFSPDLSEMGKDLSGEAYIQQLAQGDNDSGRFRTGTDDMVVSYVPVFVGVPTERASWYMLSEQSWSEIMQPSLPYQRLLLGLLALGVIVPVLVTAYGVRHITDPIQKLIRATGQVTAGQYKHRIEVKTGDEIETLADQFNLMSAELDESYSSLEKKVADRTQELTTLNAIAASVSSSLNLNEIMADALEQIMELTGMEHGIAYRIEGGEGSVVNTGTDAQEAHLRVMAFRGLPATFADLGDRLPLSRSAAGESGRRGEPVIWTLAELPTVSAVRERIATLGVEQVVVIPLMTKGRLVGSLNLSTNQSQTYPPEQIALLKTIGQQVAVAMENARLYEQAEHAAIAAERSRLARELHDAVTQTLFSANLIADVIPRIWKRNPEEGMQNLEELRQLTRGALAEMRTLLLEMRPEALERSDIKALFTQLSEAFIGRVRVPVSLDIQGDCELTHEVKLVFYRVAQEALNNIAKHSGARQVDINLACQTGYLHLFIKDDGLGFETASIPPDHLGIAIMGERASSIGAHLTIESQLGQGTTVELEWGPARKE